MIGKRYVDADKLVAHLQEAGTGGILRLKVESWLRRQPKAPKLIGRQQAAEILGVGSPYMTHFIKSGALKAIEVEGGKPAYDEAEVRALDRKRKREAKEKEKV